MCRNTCHPPPAHSHRTGVACTEYPHTPFWKGRCYGGRTHLCHRPATSLWGTEMWIRPRPGPQGADTGCLLALSGCLGKGGCREEKPSKEPSPPAQHDDTPRLGVDSAVVTVRPDTCGEAKVLSHPKEKGSCWAAWTDTHGRHDSKRTDTAEAQRQVWNGAGAQARSGLDLSCPQEHSV